jgi:hypothetical protein
MSAGRWIVGGVGLMEAARSGETPARSGPVADHLVELAGGWRLWRWAGLRGTGFPVELVLPLATLAGAAAVDRWIVEGVEATAAVRAGALAVCHEFLAAGAGPERRRLAKVIERLRQGHAPPPWDADSAVGAALARLRLAEAREAALRREAELLLQGEELRIGGALREVARDPMFREALVWQNRAALRRGVDALLRQRPGANDFKTRQNERLVAGYLQRYCTKNDTIGFFGPVGWACLEGGDAGEPGGSPLVIRPGPGLLATRTVYFEHWCIDRLAETLASDPTLRPTLAPRRMPTVWIEGTTLHHPVNRTSELPREHARLLAACDGTETARAIARRLLAEPELEVESEVEVYALLEELVAHKLVTWTLALPPAGPYPERTLRELLERLEPSDGRARALAALAEFEAGREAVGRAAGDAVLLDQAMEALAGTFRRLTGEDEVRHSGEIYAGRTLVYEDCRRDVSVTLGRELLESLGEPLGLVLRSARWLTSTLAERYRLLCERTYDELVAETGARAVDFLQFFDRIAPHFGADASGAPPSVGGAVEELAARWAQILAIAPGARRVAHTARALQGRVEEAFSAPGPGWPMARYHSPDVLLAARGPEAVARGEYLLVLGELHVGLNTLTAQLFVKEHPEPGALLQALKADFPAPEVKWITPKARLSRADHVSLAPGDVDVEVGATRSHRPAAAVLAIGELVVERAGERLAVRTRDGRQRHDLGAFLEHHLIAEASARFRLLPLLPHVPRVTIDRLVVCRERWVLLPDAFGFAHAAQASERFMGARRLARAQGMPRFVFFKIPEEPKPCYLDFASPIYVEIFAKQLRQASQVIITEMLPGPEEAWLVDAAGRAYLSELRLVAVDPMPWQAR